MKIERSDNKLVCYGTTLFILDCPLSETDSPEKQLFTLVKFLTSAYTGKSPRGYTIWSHHSSYVSNNNYPKYGLYCTGAGLFMYANPQPWKVAAQKYEARFDISRVVRFINHIGQFFDLRSELAVGYMDSLNAKR